MSEQRTVLAAGSPIAIGLAVASVVVLLVVPAYLLRGCEGPTLPESPLKQCERVCGDLGIAEFHAVGLVAGSSCRCREVSP